MRQALFVIVLALGLTGCGTLNAVMGFSVTQGELDAARSSYDGFFLAPAAHYRTLPLCAAGQTFLKNQCRTHKIAARLQAADTEVAKAFDDVQAKVTAGDSSGAIAAMQVLNIAIATAKQILSDNGISF